MSSARGAKSTKAKEEKDTASLDASYQKWINQQMEKRYDQMIQCSHNLFSSYFCICGFVLYIFIRFITAFF